MLNRLFGIVIVVSWYLVIGNRWFTISHWWFEVVYVS